MPSLLSSAKKFKYFVVVAASFQKVSFSSVYTRPESPKTISFSNFSTLESVFKFFRSHRHRFRVNRRPKRKNIFADSLTPVPLTKKHFSTKADCIF